MTKKYRKLNEELIADIKKYLSNGLTKKDACDILGISAVILCRWTNVGEEIMEKDPNSTRLEVKLVKALKEANANFKAYHLQNIMKAGKHDWKASAWMLERKFNDEFGRVDRNKISSDNDSGIQIQIVNDVPHNN